MEEGTEVVKGQVQVAASSPMWWSNQPELHRPLQVPRGGGRKRGRGLKGGGEEEGSGAEGAKGTVEGVGLSLAKEEDCLYR